MQVFRLLDTHGMTQYTYITLGEAAPESSGIIGRPLEPELVNPSGGKEIYKLNRILTD